jgi:hypothetical protein
MKRDSLPKDADELLMLGEAVAAMLAENQDRLNIPTEVEALLRASIAAAEFAIDAYVAMLAGSYKSPEAINHLDEARSRCDRNFCQLKRRVHRSIAQLRRYMGHKEFARAAMSIRM